MYVRIVLRESVCRLLLSSSLLNERNIECVHVQIVYIIPNITWEFLDNKAKIKLITFCYTRRKLFDYTYVTVSFHRSFNNMCVNI